MYSLYFSRFLALQRLTRLWFPSLAFGVMRNTREEGMAPKIRVEVLVLAHCLDGEGSMSIRPRRPESALYIIDDNSSALHKRA
jgi:hypothetical protein